MPYGFSPNANIANSEIVFAGFGITAGEANYDDYAGFDVRNKIVAVFDGNARRRKSAFAVCAFQHSRQSEDRAGKRRERRF